MNSGKKNDKQNLILYFQVHQPRRLNPVNFFDLPNEPHYFNDALNESIVRRVAQSCYIPANNLLLAVIREFPQVKITFSLSGIVMEQLEAHAPEVIESFRQLAQTGSVEFLSETYYHSLSSLSNTEEFEDQVLQHAAKIFELFGVRPVVFRNTELIYSDAVGKRIAMMGFRGIFTEGHESLLGNRSPHELYHHPEEQQLKIFLRNYRLSDDIAFRFMEGGNRLSVKKYLGWLEGMPRGEKLINLAMDYETFGEHHKAETGVFDFLRDLLKAVAVGDRYDMVLPSEALDRLEAGPPLSTENWISWADLERDLSAWLGNDMQRDAFNSIMKLEREVKGLGDESLLKYWRYLQTSDHFYYMSVKTDTDGSVHSYFSPFPSSYEAFINYMNVVTHLTFSVQSKKNPPLQDEHDLASREAERQNLRATTPVWVMNLESVPQGNVPDSLS
ncbi:MAG: glycoside hydrolase family 57 protein [Chryseosolibacter sp.]